MSQQLRASLCGVKLQQRPSAARPLARVPARRSSVSVQAVQASPVPPVWRDAPEPKGTSRPSVNAPPAPASTSAASSNASIANVRTSSTTAPAPADAPAVGGSKAKTYEALKTLFTDGVENGGSVDDDNKCGVFINREGDLVNVMCCDYGFRSGAGRLYQSSDGRIPCGALELAFANFGKELQALRQSFRFDEYSDISSAQPKSSMLGSFGRWVGGGVVQGISALDKALESGNVLRKLEAKDVPDEVKDKATGSLLNDCSQIRNRLKQLKLSNHAVWERERLREATGGGVETPLVVKVVYYALCIFLDVMFDNRPIQRFWFLETVARMPYFSYISMLHLYESLGWWRAGAELRKVHFAEEWNEMHHLQIMESLGGDQLWFDRFLGQHAAIVYYWILVAMFLLAPNLAYNFSELIEAHAVDTYGEFVDANEELLKQLPPPLVAATYYSSGDLYMFDEFQTSRHVEPRRPSCSTLYDVFSNIRDDEGEHVKTMRACQDTSIIKDLVARREQGRSI